MDLLGKLLDTVIGGLPIVASSLCPNHLKKRWLERLDEHNPFKNISANSDLIRATRLAWIEAARDVLKEGLKRAGENGAAAEVEYFERFDAVIKKSLRDAEALALDRRKHTKTSPVDAHVQAVITGVPELVSPGEHVGIGAGVTVRFTATLAGLSSWSEQKIPAIYQQIADDGLPIHGGGPKRPFGELVFAAFAEIIKDPKKYPQAREAFYISTQREDRDLIIAEFAAGMDKLGRDIGQATLDAVAGLDGKLDDLIEGLDALNVLRKGAIRYLELLPEIATGVGDANRKLDAQRKQLDELVRIARSKRVPPESASENLRIKQDALGLIASVQYKYTKIERLILEMIILQKNGTPENTRSYEVVQKLNDLSKSIHFDSTILIEHRITETEIGREVRQSIQYAYSTFLNVMNPNSETPLNSLRHALSLLSESAEKFRLTECVN